ncbi:tryptophan synthase beta subunit-like PLP-dependent enzyme [Diplogelasinospora grovesii]|uniref:Tryptophan synthase beta subunit-like PLP-dependent enzyme n=1 Tax=Diplogelasinospora grovesii TaxID=303347 RepID=A0AAN6MZ16_9PEZI|nr:tryptophan synthase beta subunit-like PLP-dependent enzyme [Diplogelasinospora grovesii]
MNPNNVYKGADSLRKYFDPDFQPPLPLVEIPDKLNPFRSDGVRIYAKMMTCLPANNVKCLPAINLLESCVKPGQTKRVVEYSSGSTVISMSMAGRVFHDIDDTRAYLSNKTSEAKLKVMQFFGLRLKLFGGPSQPEPLDPRGGIQAAHSEAEESPSTINPNQYGNDANWKAHYRWTGPQLMRQLPEINVLCTGMGTSGTMTGIGTYLKDHKPSVTRVGVCTAAGDRVPGPRSLALMSPIEFPWRNAVDAIEEVGSAPSYSWSMRLSREGLVAGPSSGFNLQGLFQFLEKRKKEGTLQELAGPLGSEIHCVFLCCDLPYQYMDEYFQKLDESHFHPIENRSLTACDLYRYDEAWELPVEEAISRFYTSVFSLRGISSQIKQGVTVLDLRRPEDFALGHLPGATNFPLETLDATMPSPFRDAVILQKQWTELDTLAKGGMAGDSIKGSVVWNKLQAGPVLVVCYDGDTARVATSVLHARNIDACSLKGGVRGLGPDPRVTETNTKSGLNVDVNEVDYTITPPESVVSVGAEGGL